MNRVAVIAAVAALSYGSVSGPVSGQTPPSRLVANEPAVSGRLTSGDATRSTGQYVDELTFDGQAGDTVSIQLTSSAFDTVLVLVGPSGTTDENDDFLSSTEPSRLDLTLSETGRYRVQVTSYERNESGAYEVLLRSTVGGNAPASASPQAGAPDAARAGAGAPIAGRLEAGDSTLRAGEYVDERAFEWQAGQRVVLDLTSTEFDPYLILIAPSGDKQENDDWEGSSRRSRIELPLTETGRYRVMITSYEKGETGAYTLNVSAIAGQTATGGAGRDGGRQESGRLASGDQTLPTGEYVDEHSFRGRRGERVTIDLRSSEFDPYVILVGPEGKVGENDDYEGDPRRSLLSMELPADGTYRVRVTSYESGETGAYDLRIQQGTLAAAPSNASAGPRVERGRLQAGDQTLKSGEYMDGYTFEGVVGQRVTLDLVSQDFDTYLILAPPRGDRHDNDDVEGRPGRSIIETDITEPGTYRVIVTSYEKGSTGDYELSIGLRTAPAAPAGETARDVVTIAYGESRDGQLNSSDTQLVNGEYRDLYAFQGQAGERIVVEMASKEFDTYLVVIPPDGQQVDNDDADGRQDLSRIEMPLREAGRYRIYATSYEAGRSGSYRVSLRRAAAAATTTGTPASSPAAATTPAGGRRVHGIFVGISDYGGRATNLRYTADDARRMQQAMIRGGGMREADSVVLVDAQATAANVRRAVENAAKQAGPNDMFMFFYSGHGGRVARTSFQAADPDNQDETLSFYDASVTDDDFAQWLSPVRAGVSLIVLDSCFSGGFSKDVINAPGRMGLFSSEEDVTSNVAIKFRAGGYLAQFIYEAVGEHLADEDGDGETTAVELSQYLHDRYRADVKSGGSNDSYVLAPTAYQHLVVDRGGVGPYDVLFRGTRAAPR